MKFFQFMDAGKILIGLDWEDKRICFTDFLSHHRDMLGVTCHDDRDPLLNLITQEFFDPPGIQKIIDLLSGVSESTYKFTHEVEFLTPIVHPERIIAIGRNYAKHAHELGNPVSDKLLFFDKSKTSLVAHGKPIVVPAWVEGRVDHEIELAVILKKGGRHIAREDTLACVAGYTIFNDVTARDLQAAAKKAGHPWFKSKNPDTFGPMGPYFVPAHFLKDPHKLELELRVNSEIRQTGNTTDMIFKIPEMISILSTYFTLLPGDIIITGTPEGVSPLYHGDVIEASITHLGTLQNPVIFESTLSPHFSHRDTETQS